MAMMMGMIMVVVGMIARLARRMMMVMPLVVTVRVMAMIMLVIITMMIMVVIAMVRMMMPVTVLVVVVMTMTVGMIVVREFRRGCHEIGSAFRIERCFDLHDARAKPAHHLLDHMIAADAERFRQKLGRQVTIAEMPGNARQIGCIFATNFDQRFRSGDHLDQAAVLQHQGVAAAQSDHVRQIEQEFQPTRAGHGHAPPMPVVEFEHDRIGGSVAPRLCGFDGSGAQHDCAS
jgi:hypothetical protein